MIERVLLVAWKGSAATSWVETLASGGYTVLLEDTTGERAWRTAKERGIDVVIIDGQKKPSHGRQTGHALRDTAKTRNIPIIWTNLDSEDSASVQAEVKPDVALVAPTEAIEALAALQALHAEHLGAMNGSKAEVSPASISQPVAEAPVVVDEVVESGPDAAQGEPPPASPAPTGPRKTIKRALPAKKATALRAQVKAKSAKKKPSPRRPGKKARAAR